jgi:hypothetical protein
MLAKTITIAAIILLLLSSFSNFVLAQNIQQVKIFSEYCVNGHPEKISAKIEDEVNDWLAQNRSIEIIKMQIHTASGGGQNTGVYYFMSVIVQYTKK